MSSTVNYRPLALIVGFAYFMEQLDTTIIAPAVPDIAAEFGIEPLLLNLSMTVYLLCNVVFVPISGYIAQRCGTRTVFQIALALFGFSSLWCAMANDLDSLIAARALQGLSAALIVPVGRTAIVHVTDRSELVKALAWMITPAMLGPVLGPPLGGLLTSWLSWHWIFLVNVPIALAGCLLAYRFVPQIVAPDHKRLDIVQWSYLAAVLALLVVALELLRHQRSLDGTATLWLYGTLAAIPLAVWLYRRHMRRLPESAAILLDFSLLKTPTFKVSFWQGGLMRVGYGALPFLLPLMIQIGLGFSAVASGMVLLASGVVALITKTFTARILRRFGFRTVLFWNGLLCALALGLCAAYRSDWGLALIAGSLALGGFFRAIQFNALSAIAYADMESRRIADATTLNTCFQQLCIMVGISLSVLVVDQSAAWFDRIAPSALDFSLAFGMLSLTAILSLPLALKLPRSAGAALSGHR